LNHSSWPCSTSCLAGIPRRKGRKNKKKKKGGKKKKKKKERERDKLISSLVQPLLSSGINLLPPCLAACISGIQSRAPSVVKQQQKKKIEKEKTRAVSPQDRKTKKRTNAGLGK
jgi:hypothetical protein